jgi:hypothetical protein
MAKTVNTKQIKFVRAWALKDEECIICGYPFDEGDPLWITHETGVVCCSMKCCKDYNSK